MQRIAVTTMGPLLRHYKKALRNEILYLLEIEVKGALQIKEKFPEAISIFLPPPDKRTLGQRLIQRNTNKEDDKETSFENRRKRIGI